VHTLVFLGFIFTFELPAVIVLGVWVILQMFSGLGSMAYSHLSQGGTAWFAHIGGFLAGILLIKLMKTREPYRHRRDLYW
jgi:membrane associated rhomboid family serine protease